MSGPLRVGLIGLGRVATLHLRGYQGDPEAKIVALCDAAPARREQFAGLVPEARLCGTLEELLDCRLDLVEILTPHPSHCAIALAALESGAHVSVQKPMALSLEEADRMAEAAARHDRVLRVFENYIFYPPLNRQEVNQHHTFLRKSKTLFDRKRHSGSKRFPETSCPDLISPFGSARRCR